MMKIIYLSFLIAISILNVQAQSKSDLEKDILKKNTIIDSLNLELKKSQMLYNYVSDSVIMNDFEPASIDSVFNSYLKTKTDEMNNMLAEQQGLSDSISMMGKQNEILKESLAICVEIINVMTENKLSLEELENGLSDDRKKIIKDLTLLTELLEEGILTQEQFDEKKTKIMKSW